MHWILVIVVYPAILITAGWAAWHFLTPEGIKEAIARGDYGNWHGLLAWFTEWPPVVWLVNQIRRLMYRLGIMEDPRAIGDDDDDDGPPPVTPRPQGGAPWDDEPPRGAPGPVPILGGPVAVPDDWALLISRITGFESDDDAALIEFFRGEAAGAIGLGEAWQAVADTHMDSIGLDPVSVQGVIEMADVHTEVAHHIGYALHRFLLVYGELMGSVAEGLILPHNARQWITGEGLGGLGPGGPDDDGQGDGDWEEAG